MRLTVLGRVTLPLVVAAGLVLAGVASVSARTGTDPWLIEFRQVTEDIHLAYRPVPLRYQVEGNVTLIFNETDVVVVDGSGSPRAARKVIAYIREQSPHPVSVLINTHGHGDHTLGNQEYLLAFPNVEILARPETRDYITGEGYPPGRGIDYVRQIAEETDSRKRAMNEEIQRLETEAAPGHEAIVANLREYVEHDIDVRQREYRTVNLTPPTMTMERRLTLHRANRAIDILYLGPGDTHGDLVVHLPDDQVVVTGDMVVHPIPFGFSRDPLEWAETLDSLALLEFDVLIPGHGDVQEGKAYLRQVRALLGEVQAQVRRAIAEGLDLEGVRALVDLSAERELFSQGDPVLGYYFTDYFISPNVTRTHNALTAKPPESR
ncbi:MAG: MBL fold metallo-hydrolase [Acidobacteria bacterium]|nr:MBL fold metallo-hydrolase [Acidobacteriota bacterium]